MSLFERKNEEELKKKNLDESVSLRASITSAITVNGHTEYVVEVERLLGPNLNFRRGQQKSKKVSDKSEDPERIKPTTWTVQKRYTDFRNLHLALQNNFNGSLDIQFPGKKITGNLDREFVAARQASLQLYMNTVLRHHFIRTDLSVRRFFDPQNYSQNFQDVAMQNVSLAFRNNPRYEIIKPLGGVGWRAKKNYFQVVDREDAKTERWLTWNDYGPDKRLDTKTLQSISKSLQNLEHPSIGPFDRIEFYDHGGLVIRRFYQGAILRDLLTDSNPKQGFLKKYCKQMKGRSFELNDLRIFSWQILDAIKFLHDKGIAHGSLHSGNVCVLQGGRPYLLDLENYFFGGSAFLRHYAVMLRGPSSSLASFDIYSFGHILFEMATGLPLQQPNCDGKIPDHLPDSLKSILEILLSSESTKSAFYPTISSIMSDPFFAGISESTDRATSKKPYLKFSASTKEALAKAKEATEDRLREDYKKIKIFAREKKRQEALGSDEERRKRQMERSQKKSVAKEEAVNGGTPNGNSVSVYSAPLQQMNPPPPPPLPPLMSSPSMSPPPPPPPPPTMSPPPPPPPPKSSGSSSPGSGSARTALLGSISSFNKGGLKKTQTIDKSTPKV